MKLGNLRCSPRELALGMLAALVLVVVVRELLLYGERCRVAGELRADPGKVAREAERFLREREEQRGSEE